MAAPSVHAAGDSPLVSPSDLLRWAEALAGIARTGLGFTENLYERERFEEVLKIAADIRYHALEEVEAGVQIEEWLSSLGEGVPGDGTPKTAGGAVGRHDARQHHLGPRGRPGGGAFPPPPAAPRGAPARRGGPPPAGGGGRRGGPGEGGCPPGPRRCAPTGRRSGRGRRARRRRAPSPDPRWRRQPAWPARCRRRRR